MEVADLSGQIETGHPRTVAGRLSSGWGWSAAFSRLLLYCAVSSVGWVAMDAFLTPFLRDSGVPVVAIGVFHGMSAAIGAPAGVIGGIVADRWGRRIAMALGGGIRILGWLLVLLTADASYLTVVACMLGIGWASSSAYMALIAETAPRGRRAFGFAVTGVVENVMSMLVPLITGVLADRLGLRTALLMALVPGVLAVVMVRWLEETGGRHPHIRNGEAVDAPDAPGQPATAASAGIRFMLSPAGRGSLLMGLIWMMTGFQFAVIGPAKPLYVADRFGVSYAGLGMVTMVGAVGMIFGQLLGGRIADRIGQSRLMAMCVASSGAMHLLLPVAPSVSMYAGLLVLANFVGWTAAPCWGAVSANSTPRDVRGSVTGLYTAMRAIGTATGGALFGFVYARGIALPFYVMALGELAVLILVLLGSRRAFAGFGKGLVHDD